MVVLGFKVLVPLNGNQVQHCFKVALQPWSSVKWSTSATGECLYNNPACVTALYANVP